MFYLWCLVWIFSISGLLTIVLNKKFGEVTILSFISGTLLLYIFSFFNELRLGFIFCWVPVFLFFAQLIFWILKKDKEKLKKFKENYFTVSFFVFLFLSVLVFIRYKNQGYSHCDEFMHWGPMVISSIQCNGFYAQTSSLLQVHKDYPPFFTLLEVLLTGFNGFEYSESICYIALMLFMFSCFLPVLEGIRIHKWKDLLKVIVEVVSFVLIGITVTETSTAQETAYVYNSIYIDWALSAFTAYLLFWVYREKDWKLKSVVLISVSLTSLLLMKQMGIAYYLIVLFYAFLKIVFVDKKINLKQDLLMIVLPVLGYLSWKWVVDLYQIEGQFVISGLNLKELIFIVKGNTEEIWRTEVFYNFLEALKTRMLVHHPLEQSYLGCMSVVVLIIILVAENRKDIFTLILTFLIGAMGYALTMGVLYVLAYSKEEALVLASYDRYMQSFFYIASAFVTMLATERANKLKENKSLVVSFVILLVISFSVEPERIEDLFPDQTEYETIRVLVVNQYEKFSVQREELNGLHLEFTELGYVEDGYITTEEWMEMLKEYDLIYVESYDDFIHGNLWKPFWPEVELSNDHAYSLNASEDDFTVQDVTSGYLGYVVKYYKIIKKQS